MWTATRYGWFSSICAKWPDGRVDPNTIMIRARVRDHLERLTARFPGELADVPIIESRNADYRYRQVLAKERFVRIMAGLAEEITWANFKSEAARFQGPSGHRYLHALHATWSTMSALQARPGAEEDTQRSRDHSPRR